MHRNNLIFTKGDLVHIPQSAILYGASTKNATIYVNQKPALAIFMDYKNDGMSEVVMNGRKWLIKNKEIYLNKEVS